MSGAVIGERCQGVSPALLDGYQGVAASTLGHLGSEGFLRGIKPLFTPVRLLGNVVTVRLDAPDGAIVREALLLSAPGDVLVLQCAGDAECGCWGELRTLAGLIKGLAGVVVCGAVTDSAALREHGLPVFSRGVSAYTTRSLGQGGEVNGTLRIGETTVRPGDLALGDDDGVYVLDSQQAQRWLPTALAKEHADRQRRDELLRRWRSA